MQRQRGATLLEYSVTLACVSLLAGVAITTLSFSIVETSFNIEFASQDEGPEAFTTTFSGGGTVEGGGAPKWYEDMHGNNGEVAQPTGDL